MFESLFKNFSPSVAKGGETLIACNTGSISVAKGVKTLLHIILVTEVFSKNSPSVAKGR